MGRSLEWNWLALASCVFLVPFTFGLYFIPEVWDFYYFLPTSFRSGWQFSAHTCRVTYIYFTDICLSVRLPDSYQTTDIWVKFDYNFKSEGQQNLVAVHYRVTHHVGQNLLLTSKQKFRFGLAWPGQAKAEHLFWSQQEILNKWNCHPVFDLDKINQN